MEDKNDDIELDLVELWHLIWANKFKVILCSILCAALAFSYAYFAVSPTYQSTAKLYVVSASNDSVVNLSDLDLGTSLTKDYEELILSYPVMNEVIENLALDADYKELVEMITLENPADTRVLRITATTTDPVLSRDIAREVTNVTIKYLPETMSTNPPNIAQKAKIERDKVAPSISKYTLIGALIGLLLMLIYCFLKLVMDDTIKTAEEMENIYGITPLTVIPFNSDLLDKKNSKSKKNGKNKKNSKSRKAKNNKTGGGKK